MFRSFRISAIAAACFLSLVPPAAAQDVPAPDGPVLTVSGEGRVSGVPDMATMRLGIVAEAETPGAAVAAMNGPASGLLDTLVDAGIEQRDIQTSDLTLRPLYAVGDHVGDDQREITGYEASTDVQVHLRALDTLGGILDDALAAGSNRFAGLSFGLSDPISARDAALADAVEDALRKARILARAAGVTLGPILRIDEAGTGGPPVPMMRAAAESDMALAPGSVETTARVSVTYALSQ